MIGYIACRNDRCKSKNLEISDKSGMTFYFRRLGTVYECLECGYDFCLNWSFDGSEDISEEEYIEITIKLEAQYWKERDDWKKKMAKEVRFTMSYDLVHRILSDYFTAGFDEKDLNGGEAPNWIKNVLLPKYGVNKYIENIPVIKATPKLKGKDAEAFIKKAKRNNKTLPSKKEQKRLSDGVDSLLKAFKKSDEILVGDTIKIFGKFNYIRHGCVFKGNFNGHYEVTKIGWTVELRDINPVTLKLMGKISITKTDLKTGNVIIVSRKKPK